MERALVAEISRICTSLERSQALVSVLWVDCLLSSSSAALDDHQKKGDRLDQIALRLANLVDSTEAQVLAGSMQLLSKYLQLQEVSYDALYGSWRNWLERMLEELPITSANSHHSQQSVQLQEEIPGWLIHIVELIHLHYSEVCTKELLETLHLPKTYANSNLSYALDCHRSASQSNPLIQLNTSSQEEVKERILSGFFPSFSTLEKTLWTEYDAHEPMQWQQLTFWKLLGGKRMQNVLDNAQRSCREGFHRKVARDQNQALANYLIDRLVLQSSNSGYGSGDPSEDCAVKVSTLSATPSQFSKANAQETVNALVQVQAIPFLKGLHLFLKECTKFKPNCGRFPAWTLPSYFIVSLSPEVLRHITSLLSKISCTIGITSNETDSVVCTYDELLLLVPSLETEVGVLSERLKTAGLVLVAPSKLHKKDLECLLKLTQKKRIPKHLRELKAAGTQHSLTADSFTMPMPM